MDIDDMDLKLPKSGGKREIQPDEASIIVTQAAGGLIGAQGSLNVLSHIQKVVMNDDNKRRNKTPGVDSSMEFAETEIEKFIKSDYPSHLLKIAELENFINISKQSTKIIDEADVSGSSLWDYIEPEMQDEIRSQLEGLKSVSAIKESLQTELKSLASDTWESHKDTKPGTESERYQHYESMLLGKDPKIKDQRDLKSVKDDILNAEEVYEMLAFEKMRMIMATSTCPPEEKPNHEKDAFEVMGEEYSLAKSQMDHLEKMLEIEWLKSVPNEGIQNPAKGESLICPEMLARMDGEPSEEQIKVLEDTYGHMAKKRTEEDTQRDKMTEKTAFCLASMQFLEMGKKAKYMNAFKEIRNASKEKIENMAGKNGVDNLKESEESLEIPEPDENAPQKNLARRGLEATKRGVGKMIKSCPAILAAQIWVMTKNKSQQEFSGHYGSMEDHVRFMKEIGLARIDDPA
jgi:hypothetical protein